MGLGLTFAYRSEEILAIRPQPVLGKHEGKLAIRDAHNGNEHERADKDMEESNPPAKKDQPDHVTDEL